MCVMAAPVHDTGDGRPIRWCALLLYGEAVEVGAEPNHRLAGTDIDEQAGSALPHAGLEPEIPEHGCDRRGRPYLLPADLRMPV